jgi:hypothetical protein
MSENLKYNTNPNVAGTLLKSKKMDLESGHLGKIFGASSNAPTNIAGLLIFLFVFTGIIILFIPCNTSASDYWKWITPLITLALGYLFGKNQ